MWGNKMEDSRIIDLYWDRDETAIRHTAEKYGRYCRKIASNILCSKEDCEECVNDTYLRAWNAMPTERPDILSAFLGAITRNLSLDRYRKNHRKKRGEGEVSLIFDELQGCVGTDGPEQHLDTMALSDCINGFLAEIEKESRMIFVRRYWYMDSTREIAEHFCISESKVKSALFRARKKLYVYLQREGFDV